MKYLLPALLAIAILAAVYYKLKADNRNRDLEIALQNQKALVDSTRLVYEDSLTGIREHARLSLVRKQREFRLIMDQFNAERRDMASRIESLVRANARLRTRSDSIATTVTRDTLFVDSGASEEVLRFGWAYSETHGASKLEMEAETGYFPARDSATTSIHGLTLDLAFLLGQRELEDGAVEHFLISDWPGLDATLEGAVSRDRYRSSGAWEWIRLGLAAGGGFVLGRL